MHNVCHELWFEYAGIPERIGLPIDNTVLGCKRRIAWYKISHGRGIYTGIKDDEK